MPAGGNFGTIDHMMKHNQDGSVVGVLLPVLLGILLVAAVIFGVWAFSSQQDYKKNVDAKVSAAVVVAKQQESTAKDVQFAEAEKSPLRAYNGPEAYGSLIVMYPKTWSAYVDDSGNGNSPVDGFFAPSVVPSITSQSSVFALRIQVESQSYSQTLQSLTSQQGVQQTVKPYALPKVPSAVGVEINGLLNDGKSGTMVVLPLRDKTLEIWTEGSQFLPDFNTYILPNFSFSP